MLRDIFYILCQVVSVFLILSGAYHGIYLHDYPQACFELLIAYGCQYDR